MTSYAIYDLASGLVHRIEQDENPPIYPSLLLLLPFRRWLRLGRQSHLRVLN